VIILPNIVFMSEKQVKASQSFIDQGGRMIWIGKVATRDLYCKPREKKSSPSNPKNLAEFESLELALPYRGIYLAEGLQGVRSIPMPESMKKEKNARYRMMAEMDKILRFKRYQEPGPVTEIIADALGDSPHLMDPYKAGGLRHTIWIKSDGGNKRLIIHLVNKNVPLAEDEGKRVLRPIENLQVSIPYLKSERLKQVNLWQIETEGPLVLRPQVRKGKIELTVPKLEAYAIIELVLE